MPPPPRNKKCLGHNIVRLLITDMPTGIGQDSGRFRLPNLGELFML